MRLSLDGFLRPGQVADFRGRDDRSLEPTLGAELPGILYRLLEIVPDVIRLGLWPPASVLRATEELFAELDVTQQFKDERLDLEEEAQTTRDDMLEEIAQWQHGSKTGLFISGTESEAETRRILSELKVLPHIVYKRARLDGGRLGWCFFGVRLKPKSP